MLALRPFIFYVLAWTVVGLISFVLGVARRFYLGDEYPWQEIGFWTVRIGLSIAFTPIVLWLEHRRPLEREHWLRIVGLHLLCSVLFALARVLSEALVHWSLPMTGFTPARFAFEDTVALLLILGFHSGVVAYWVVFAIQSALRYYGEMQSRALQASQLAAQVAEARLSSLKAQLQPHFLFNTLNAIMVLVRQRQWRPAEETLARLSDLLRAVLHDGESQQVTLAREFEHVRLYLSIEELRFSDRLRFDLSADSDAREALVPHMALQPLVENAIKHGVGKRAATGYIEVTAKRVAEELHIAVRDNGPGFATSVEKDAATGSGIGLANVRARLKQLYGASADVIVGQAPGGGALVRLILPFMKEPS